MRIQFDTCTTEGWNVDGQLYGQVKPEDDNYSCFTVTNVSGDTTIGVQPCSSSNDDLLRNQWFKAEWDDQGGFHVISTGNPNDNPIIRPDTSYNYYTQPSGDENQIYIRKQGTDPRYGTSLTEFQFIGLESY